MKYNWLDLAKAIDNIYGCAVDWEEEWCVCPECAEPIYAEDWSGEDSAMDVGACPICDFQIVE